MKTFTATQAKQNFGELLDTLDKEDVSIVRNGRQIAIVSSSNRDKPLPDVSEVRAGIIREYFNGSITRQKAMRLGYYKWYGELLDDAFRLAIQIPDIPENEINRMSNNLLQMIGDEK